jgi:hypothetical protein
MVLRSKNTDIEAKKEADIGGGFPRNHRQDGEKIIGSNQKSFFNNRGNLCCMAVFI